MRAPVRARLLSVLALGVVVVVGVTFFASRDVLLTIDSENVRVLRQADLVDESIWEITWSPDGERVAFVRWEKPVEIRDARTLRVERQIGEGRKIIHFAFSPDPDVVAFCENDSSVEIHDLDAGTSRRIHAWNSQPGMRFSPARAPGERPVTSPGSDAVVVLTRLTDSREQRLVAGEPERRAASVVRRELRKVGARTVDGRFR